MTRRDLLVAGQLVLSGGLMNPIATSANNSNLPPKWQIGCFNRPWSHWTFDDALDGMKAAGFKQIGLLGDHAGETFIYPESSPEYLQRLAARIDERGLNVIFGRLHTRFDIPLSDSIAEVRTQIDNAAQLKLKYVMALGADKADEYESFYQLMTATASYAHDRHIQLVFKPHGGISATSKDMLRCIDRIGLPNFKLWYDAGNIIHYTGKDPLAELEPVIKHVSGLCAKDCAKQSGDVMIQFGEGKVDFAAVLKRLAKAKFDGPIMIECSSGTFAQEVTRKVTANKLYLERILREIVSKK